MLGKSDQDKGKPNQKEKDSGSVARVRPGVADILAGESKSFKGRLSPFLPQELIGGTIPHVPGTEDEAVWNAAAQACATEKVHYVFTVEGKRVYYLACPSSMMASHPDSWCPLAAALPGNSEYWDTETVYLYEQEGIASALRWDPETDRMQVFLGASRTILPRVQSMDANFVTINPEVADVVPWRNQSLRTEKLARATINTIILTGLMVTLLSIGLVFWSIVSINMLERNLDQVKYLTNQATVQLIRDANNAMQSELIDHLTKIQTLLDRMPGADGTMVRYEVNKGKTEWEVMVLPAYAERFGKASEEGIGSDGRVRVIGN